MLERKLRLFSGLVLAVYVIPHVLNQALGLISLEMMDSFHKPFALMWQWLPMTILLYGAFMLHLTLGLYSLWQRTTLRMPAWEGLQLCLGLIMVPLLLSHLITTRLSSELLSTPTDYEYVIGYLWNLPGQWLKQSLLLLVTWLHLAFGLYYWLRLKLGHQRWFPLWQSMFLLIPLIAILGFIHAGRDIGYVDVATNISELRLSRPDQMAFVEGLEPILQGIFISSLFLVLVLRLFRNLYKTRMGPVKITHPNHGVITAQVGQTLLEALRQAGIPHASVCGGRGRCTTCQVKITSGLEQLDPPSSLEQKALAGINAERGVRLACQLRIRKDISIKPLVPPELAHHYLRKPGGLYGEERSVAVMFVDLRDSTLMEEGRLPYDVVFILNQFFTEMTEALDESGGHYAQFNGDGLMALYGLETNIELGCRASIEGAKHMFRRLELLNRRLKGELIIPLRMGIGIHSGRAIVGTMGPPRSPIISAVGDNINIAARLEAHTKVLGCSLIISKVAAEHAEIVTDGLPFHHLKLNGRPSQLGVFAVTEPADIKLTNARNQVATTFS
jgi:adenylate cyclase